MPASYVCPVGDSSHRLQAPKTYKPPLLRQVRAAAPAAVLMLTTVLLVLFMMFYR